MKVGNPVINYLIGFGLLFLMATQVQGRSGLPDFTELVEDTADAVVNISTSKPAVVQRGLPPGMEIPGFPKEGPFGDLFQRFFW